MDHLILRFVFAIAMIASVPTFASECQPYADKIGAVLIVEGKKIRSLADFHKQLSESAIFPPYYGKNLDAFFDVLLYIESPFNLLILDHELVQKRLPKDYARIIKTFNDAKAMRSPEVLCLVLE